MYDFSKITNWKLLSGSHDFPGAGGGTCINEAAIVAAGFKYKKISSANDCPPCFSRPIAAYAIKLNDSMPNELRQELLMPFVTRLSGTADTRKIEVKRVQFMALENCRRIMSMLCVDVLKRPDFAECCRNATNLKEAEEVCREIRTAADAAAVAYAAAAAAADDADAAKRKYYTVATQILDEAIMVGNHATDVDIGLVNKRMETAKCKVAA